MVGWRTSSIRRQHELPKVKLAFFTLHFISHMPVIVPNSFHFRLQSNLLVTDDKYPHIVHVKRETFEDIHNNASSTAESQKIDLEGLSYIVLAELCLIRLWPRCWG